METQKPRFKLFSFLRKNEKILSYFLVFIVAFSIFFYLQYSSTLADPDSFYHAKITVLIKEQGIIKDFSWTQFTLYKDYYIDHHFLYHIFLIPFVVFLDPLIGIKVATAFFAIISIILFYWFLKRFNIRFSLFYSILLLFINPFIFRFSLGKAPAVFFIFLILGIYFLFKKKNIALFFISFFYVWLYSAWPLILIFTITYIFINLVFALYKKDFANFSLKPLIVCLSGLAGGIIINPYFPKNLVYYKQIFKMALAPYHKILDIGAEWYPYNFFDLISNASFVFILFSIALVLFFIFFKKQSKESLVLLLFSLFLFFYTIKARRQVEYFIPIAVLFCAFSLNDSLRGVILKDYWLKFLELFKKKRIIISCLLIYFFIGAPFVIIRDVWRTKNNLKKRFSLNSFEDVSHWLKNNTPEKSIIFQSSWSSFPMLFYYNSHNYYLTGLDQTFMYEYNKDLYWTWHKITMGEKRENIYQIIKDDFRASYVLVEKNKLTFNNSIKMDKRFENVYEDDEVWLYEIK